MDGVKLTLEDKEFTKAFRQYVELSDKTLAESINKKTKDLCFAAARQIVPGAPHESYTKGHRIYNILAAGGNRRKNGESLETRFGKKPKGKGNKALANKIYGRRKRSIGYSRALLIKLASDFGARLTVKAGKIKYANGKPAKPEIKPKAILDIKGLEKSHVDKVIQPAFDGALRVVAKDMQVYIDRKLAQAAKKHSGKKRV